MPGVEWDNSATIGSHLNLRKEMSTVFVGRRREMATLEAALANAMLGREQIIMLAGEPGIGKTRIAQELASHASSLGAQTFWG